MERTVKKAHPPDAEGAGKGGVFPCGPSPAWWGEGDYSPYSAQELLVSHTRTRSSVTQSLTG